MSPNVRKCGDCGAAPGKAHVPGCDVERCALCSGQAMCCPCLYELSGIEYSTMEATHPDIYRDGPTEEMQEALAKAVAEAGGPLPWTGTWPGKDECRELGLYCYWGDSKWIPCERSHPGSQEDLNRLYEITVWDKALRRRVLAS